MTEGNTTDAGFVKPKVVTALRQKDGLSLRALAEATGISPSYLSKIEAGVKNPEPTVALRLANALDVPLEAIYDLNPSAGFELYVLKLPKEATSVAS